MSAHVTVTVRWDGSTVTVDGVIDEDIDGTQVHGVMGLLRDAYQRAMWSVGGQYPLPRKELGKDPGMVLR